MKVDASNVILDVVSDRLKDHLSPTQQINALSALSTIDGLEPIKHLTRVARSERRDPTVREAALGMLCEHHSDQITQWIGTNRSEVDSTWRALASLRQKRKSRIDFSGLSWLKRLWIQLRVRRSVKRDALQITEWISSFFISLMAVLVFLSPFGMFQVLEKDPSDVVTGWIFGAATAGTAFSLILRKVLTPVRSSPDAVVHAFVESLVVAIFSFLFFAIFFLGFIGSDYEVDFRVVLLITIFFAMMRFGTLSMYARSWQWMHNPFAMITSGFFFTAFLWAVSMYFWRDAYLRGPIVSLLLFTIPCIISTGYIFTRVDALQPGEENQDDILSRPLFIFPFAFICIVGIYFYINAIKTISDFGSTGKIGSNELVRVELPDLRNTDEAIVVETEIEERLEISSDIDQDVIAYVTASSDIVTRLSGIEQDNDDRGVSCCESRLIELHEGELHEFEVRSRTVSGEFDTVIGRAGWSLGDALVGDVDQHLQRVDSLFRKITIEFYRAG